MKALDVFQYEDFPVRVVTDEHGEPWFVANDVASVLGVQNIRQVIAGLDPDDVSTAYVTDALGREQPTRTVDESGLYALIFQSRKQQAKAFQRWVTHEVLPQIRRTGSYVAPVEDDATLVARALVAAQGMLSAKDAQIAELEPRAEAWDAFLDTAADYKVADAAKMLARDRIGVGQNRLFDVLHTFGWIYRGSHGKWEARQTAVNSGYLVHKPQSHHHPRTGELVADPPQVRVTVKGLQRLKERLTYRPDQAIQRALETISAQDAADADEVLHNAVSGGGVAVSDLYLTVPVGDRVKSMEFVTAADLAGIESVRHWADDGYRRLRDALFEHGTFGAAYAAGAFVKEGVLA